jgi:hypothetical protein
VTDYNGFWWSSSNNVNPVKPDNSHNLLSFSYYGRRISTGVSDSTLRAKGLSFLPGDYRALPVQSITGTITSNTKIGLGEKYDGVTNGRPTTSPRNDIAYYLTDGKQGLDLGTGAANLPTGTLNFSVSNISIAALNDSIPDVVITQTADPSGSEFDRYEFTDINGNRVGNYVDIILNTLPAVGNWMADFYEASTNPMTLAQGFTNTQRGLRLWAADFSVFGINASNISRIAYFRINLNGNSDVSFVAYNSRALNVNLVLPTELVSFTGKSAATATSLNWSTASESNSNKFIVEKSFDGANFSAVASVDAKGNSNRLTAYSQLLDGDSRTSYYRLKMTDTDGKFTYSKTIKINGTDSQVKFSIFPNPATTSTRISHAVANDGELVQLYTNAGILVKQVKATGTQTTIELSNLNAGAYQLLFRSKTTVQTASLIVSN